jgi:aldehyde dehydrogenase (NAD+)
LVLPPEREWGPKLAEAAVDHIVFTGHDQTGRKLAARLGERLISSTLELSGHDAVLVLEDADLDLAARAICFAVTVNAGQTCLAARRVFVHRSICADLQRRLKERFQSEPPIRPLARTGQSDQADELVQSALRDGANLLLDSPAISNGQRSTQPIVVTNVRPEMRICHEALFAPVVAVLPFEEITQAVTAIRAGEFGLGLSLFTADLKRAKQLAAQLPAGLVSINDIIAPAAHPETPLGGVGRSGWGSTQGVEGLLEMTVPQVISWRTSRWRPHYDRPGASPFTDPGVLSAMLRWRYDGSLGKRLRSFFSLIRAARIARKNAKQIETQGSGASARPSRKNA